MKKNDPSLPVKPSVQVLERMFTLIDVLASREEAISLKEISEKTTVTTEKPKTKLIEEEEEEDDDDDDDEEEEAVKRAGRGD